MKKAFLPISIILFLGFACSKKARLQNAIIVCDGNSLTLGTAGNPGGKSYPMLLSESRLAKDNNMKIINRGVNSQTTQHMIDDYTSDILPLKSLGTNILIVWECTNDLYFGATVKEAFDNSKSYCQKARSDGWKVIVMSALPRGQLKLDGSSISTYNAQLDSINYLLYANWHKFADAYVDVRGDKRLTDYRNSVYFSSDSIHLAEAGYKVVVDLLKPVIESL
jgi:lysophospholipase L1-like esterase